MLRHRELVVREVSFFWQISEGYRLFPKVSDGENREYALLSVARTAAPPVSLWILRNNRRTSLLSDIILKVVNTLPPRGRETQFLFISVFSQVSRRSRENGSFAMGG